MIERTQAATPPAQRLVLGDFVLDLARGELLTATGELAGLRRQALEVLLHLGQHAGQVVSKDELMRRVWPNVVVGEGSLTQAVSDIRRVLGDHAHQRVRNVARRGYQLVPTPGDEPEAATAGTVSEPAAPKPHPRWWALPAVLLVLGVATGWAWLNRAPRWVTPAELAHTPLPHELPPLSIIVLPLTVEGDAVGESWLADALHGDLVIGVARLHKSLVISRDTAATYKGRNVDPRQVAREIGVRHVVRGSLRQEGTSIRLNLALIDGETGSQRWAESLSTERARLAQTVGDFAVAIERTLAGELLRASVEQRALQSPSQVSADDLAMQGFALWYRGVNRDNVLAAHALFERAVAMDADSARAWAGIQFTTINLLLNGWAGDRARAMQAHEEAAAQLERLDRDGHYTYQAKASLLFLKRDFPAMLPHTAAWIERYRLPTAFGTRGMALMFNGQLDDAVEPLERALRLSPRDPFRAEWQYRLALAHFGAGRFELARDWSQTAATTNARLLWPPIHAAALLRLGHKTAAQQAYADHIVRHPGFVAAHVKTRLPSEEPRHAEMRTRLLEALRELGMRD